MAVKKGRTTKVVLAFAGLALLGTGGAVAAMASRYVPLVKPGTSFKGQPLAGLTREEVAAKVDAWWKDESQRTLSFKVPGIAKVTQGYTMDGLGVGLDKEATLAKLPFDDFWTDSTRRLRGGDPGALSVDPVLRIARGKDWTQLQTYVEENAPGKAPARVEYKNGQIIRTPESVGIELDVEGSMEKVLSGLSGEDEIELVVKKGTPKISDNDLAQIKEVVSEFTTRYSEGNRNRSHNIKNAAERLSGTILMPGDVFSFNKILGQRTAKNGFKVAGVYNNGRHDFDIGGGICQVSSTLYNSVLLANLKIKSRYCHTFPVPYVPVGRDATVSFPGPDFAFENSGDTPIALSVRAGGGSITFTVLGTKDPGLSVKVETAGHTSWSRGEKVINDPSLPPGRRVVEEKGGAGHKISTYRVVYRDGKEVERESLGTSLYNGGPRIVRVNRAAKKTAAPEVEVPAGPVEDESPDAPGPGGMDDGG